MRNRMLGLMMAAGLLVGAQAVPAAAQGNTAASQGKGCPNIGVEWSAWGQLGPEGDPTADPPIGPIGPTTASLAQTDPAGYSHIIADYCD